jgi:REP element-mobilizing transposase RayT
MPNHVHLLVTPPQEETLAKMMQGIALCYTQHLNRISERPADYLYSSARAHILGRKDQLLNEPLFDKNELSGYRQKDHEVRRGQKDSRGDQKADEIGQTSR